MSTTLVRLVQRAPLRACYAVSLHEENLGETGAGHLCVTPMPILSIPPHVIRWNLTSIGFRETSYEHNLGMTGAEVISVRLVQRSPL